jgi:hypothetical protein
MYVLDRTEAAGLMPGNHLWVIDGQATGAGAPGFAAALQAVGLRYAPTAAGVRIVRHEACQSAWC